MLCIFVNTTLTFVYSNELSVISKFLFLLYSNLVYISHGQVHLSLTTLLKISSFAVIITAYCLELVARCGPGNGLVLSGRISEEKLQSAKWMKKILFVQNVATTNELHFS